MAVRQGLSQDAAVGFGELVGTVYPICGYCGAFALIGLLRHRLLVRAMK